MQYICTKSGCPEAKENQKLCASCGFEEHERNRRRALPLEELENGLKGKIIRRSNDKI